jgi:AraC-like DNA-binding protein
MVRRIPLSRCRQLLPFVDFLERAGAPVDHGLERSGLPPAARERPDSFVGTRAMSRFVRDMASREGIDAIGWKVYAATDPASFLGPTMTRALFGSPSLLSALRLLVSGFNRESSTLRLWLEEAEEEILLCHESPVERAMNVSDLSAGRASGLISIIRGFAGPDWTPIECGIVGEDANTPVVCEALPETRIVRAPDFGWLRLPRSILALPSRRRPAQSPGHGAEAEEEAAADLIGSLRQLLRPYLARRPPTLQEAAELAGTSVRSLQRDLAASGISYRDVLLRAKLDTARGLLRQPDIPIMDVAQQAGFSDQANFTRFFRNCAGLTPSAYRSAHLEGRPWPQAARRRGGTK